MPLDRPVYQLELELELPEDGEAAVTPDVARLRSETARETLEKYGGERWMEEYRKLRDGGWPWRVAAYIAWASSPKAGRQPKTQDDLARQNLGLMSDRAINTWRKKNPAIDEMVAILQAAPLWDYRAEVFAALTENASKPDYKTHNDRKLFLELTGDYIPQAKLAALLTKGNLSKEDLASLSDAELAELSRSVLAEIGLKKTTTTRTDE